MESFKGKIKEMKESILTPRRMAKDPRGNKTRVRMTLRFDPEGHLQEERHYDRKRANRITYLYNRGGKCVERHEFNMEHTLFRHYSYKYDRWGHQIEEQGFDETGNLRHYESYVYNEKGMELEHRRHRGESSEKLEYKFDAEGRATEEYITRNGKYDGRRTYLYDEHGQIVESMEMNAEGILLHERYEYDYDEQGRIVEERILDTDKIVEARYTFEYDAQGHTVERKQYDNKGHFNGTRHYYNEQGDKTTTWWYDNNSNSCGRMTFLYDEHHRLTQEMMEHGSLTALQQELDLQGKEVVMKMRYEAGELACDYLIVHSYYPDGTVHETKEEHYDESGTLVQHILRQYDSLGNLLLETQNSTTVQYQYDAFGNWVKRTHTFEDDVMEIVERKISYYAL